MRTLLLALSIVLLPVIADAQETNGNWILQMQFPRFLREQVPQVQLGGSVGSVGTEKLGSNIIGRRNEIYTIQSSKGFAPDLVKAAVDKRFKGAFSTVFTSSTGSQQTGFVSHDWRYHEEESGIVGRLTIWFPDTNAKPMKMVVVIDERKSR